MWAKDMRKSVRSSSPRSPQRVPQRALISKIYTLLSSERRPNWTATPPATSWIHSWNYIIKPSYITLRCPMRSISNMSKNCNDSFLTTAFRKSWPVKTKSPLSRKRARVPPSSNHNRPYPTVLLSLLNRKNLKQPLPKTQRNKKLAFSRKIAEQL